MDLQDQKKTTPSAHESQAVYVCHQCGWPYPKPHPSSKHRRAHKRLCGKLEGHKLLKSDSDPLHLSVSDDERLSDDDDRRTPSPKVVKENVNTVGSSGGNVLRSYRSEDDVFSDAFTEFSDSGASPGIDTRLRSGEKLDADVKRDLTTDLTNNKVTEDYETSGKTETSPDLFESTLPKSPVTGTTTIGSGVVGTEMCLSRSTEPAGETEDYAEQNDLATKPAQVSSEPIVHSKNCKHEKEELITSVHADDQVNKVGNGTENVGVSSGGTGQNGLAIGSDQVIDKPTFHSENFKHEKGELITPVHADLANKVGLGTDSQYIKSQAAGDAAQLECKFRDTEEQFADPVTPECMVPEIGTEISYPLSMHEYNLVDSRSLTAGAVAETVEENEEELVSKLQTETMTHDISSQPCSISGSVPIKEEADLDIGSTSRTLGQPAEFSDLKEEERIDTKISVTETLAALEKPEIFSGDFKDLRVFKSSIPLGLGDTEVTLSADDKNEATEPEEHESILSSDLVTLSKSSSNLDDNEVEIQKAVLSPDEVLVTSGSMATHDEVLGYNESEAPPGYDNDNQANKDHKDSQPYSDDAKPLKPDDSELMTGGHLDVINVPSIGEGTSQNTTLNKDANVDANGMAESLHVHTVNEISEGDVHSGKGTAMSAHAEGPVETEDVQCPNPLAGEGFVAPENLVSHFDNNHESFQHQTNSSESDVIVDSELENISSRDLANLADFSTSCNSLDEHENVKDFVVSMPLPDEGDDRMVKHLGASPVDMSVPSSRRTDSLEGNWGSASVVSNQSDVAAIGETEVPVSSDSQITGKLEENSLNSQDNAKECHLEKTDDFEPPSFATLVQSGFQHNQKDAASELQKDGQPKSEAVEAGWFPSITNVVKESEGRKKNEEMIAKVTNWSAGKQQHSPLKSLLNEAHEETYAIQPPSEPKQASGTDQAHEIGLKNNGNGGAVTTTVSSIMGSEHAAANKEMEKEWDSPARYPAAIKKEKKKGKPYWVPFVCCSSMHRDI